MTDKWVFEEALVRAQAAGAHSGIFVIDNVRKYVRDKDIEGSLISDLIEYDNFFGGLQLAFLGERLTRKLERIYQEADMGTIYAMMNETIRNHIDYERYQIGIIQNRAIQWMNNRGHERNMISLDEWCLTIRSEIKPSSFYAQLEFKVRPVR